MLASVFGYAKSVCCGFSGSVVKLSCEATEKWASSKVDKLIKSEVKYDLCKILFCYGSDYEECHLLGCDTM
jgi:hypothetical protein